MVMIKQHYQEQINQNIIQTLRNFFIKSNFEKSTMGQWIRKIKLIIKPIEIHYINRKNIDDYID
jgi:lipoate-protein ligase B